MLSKKPLQPPHPWSTWGRKVSIVLAASTDDMCWWFRNPRQPPFGCIKTLLNHGKNYQPSTGAGFLPSTVSILVACSFDGKNSSQHIFPLSKWWYIQLIIQPRKRGSKNNLKQIQAVIFFKSWAVINNPPVTWTMKYSLVNGDPYIGLWNHPNITGQSPYNPTNRGEMIIAHFMNLDFFQIEVHPWVH